MEEHPPYLFATALDEAAYAPLTVTADVDGAVLDVVVRGAWHAGRADAVLLALRKCLAESPAVVIIDAGDLADDAAASVPVWLSATQAAAATDPPARLAICLPESAPLAIRLRSVGAGRYLPSFVTPEEARKELAGSRPLAEVVRMRLPPSPVSPSVARNLVGGACQAWHLPKLLHPGRAVISELVANAAEHAGTEMEVSISRRGTGLHLAVRDRSPTLPRMLELSPVVPGKPLNERGHGLCVVDADSVVWGAMPTAGGKIVWATVRDRGGRRRRW
jgi:anti-sigma regulatory factor (Ser/Thr protein kinase)